MRGILTDVHGLDPDTVTWVTFENSYLAEYADLPNVECAAPGKVLERMVEGELDAAILSGTQNPEWGVRDVDDLRALAQDAGLILAEMMPMPANNLVLAFARAVRHS